MPLYSNETMAMPQLWIYAHLVFNSLINTHGGMQHLMQTSQKENMFRGIGYVCVDQV
jgi:hypothetical protein